jgi:hypothetical protein
MPSTSTDVMATKPLPLMETELGADPAINVEGEICVIVGSGLLIWRLLDPAEILVPPLFATTDMVFPFVSRLVGTITVTTVLLT